MVGMVHGMIPLAVLIDAAGDARCRPQSCARGPHPGSCRRAVLLAGLLSIIAAGRSRAAGLLVFITSLGFFIVPALLGGARETMISQVIISTLLELMNWRFAGALALVLLVAAMLVFYLYDRPAGGSRRFQARAAASGTPDGRGIASRLAMRVSTKIVAVLGSASDAIGAALARLSGIDPNRPRRSIPRALLVLAAVLVLTFMLVPTFFVVPVSFTAGSFMSFPPHGLSLRWYQVYLDSPTWWSATVRSLSVATTTAMIATILGTGAALVLARQRVPGRVAVMTLILAPLILPRIITAVALFYLFARNGPRGVPNSGSCSGTRRLPSPRWW